MSDLANNNKLLPKKLYHGTSSAYLPRIAEVGLESRGPRKGNWSHTCQSRQDAVYLTVAYPLYYACVAANEVGQPTILEIDVSKLDINLLCSDEDAIAHTKEGKQLAGSSDLKAVTEYWRERIHLVPATRSLDVIGNCAYLGTIPPDAISQLLVLSPDEADLLTICACDPVIVPLNYRFHGEEYKNFTNWLFRSRVERLQDERYARLELEAQACSLQEALAGCKEKAPD